MRAAVRDRLLDRHRGTLEDALSCADAVAAGWDGPTTEDRTEVVGPYRATLERAGLLAPLVAALSDAVAAAGHKWLLGLWGGGFLYVDRTAADSLLPTTVGYRSVETPTADSYEFVAGARRFEVGSANPTPHVALAEAIEVIEEVGVNHIAARIRELAGRLAEEIPDNRLLSPSDPESGLVTVDVDNPEETVDRLASEGIVVRALPTPDAVRASVHAVNTRAEIDRLLDALESEWN